MSDLDALLLAILAAVCIGWLGKLAGWLED